MRAGSRGCRARGTRSSSARRRGANRAGSQPQLRNDVLAHGRLAATGRPTIVRPCAWTISQPAMVSRSAVTCLFLPVLAPHRCVQVLLRLRRLKTYASNSFRRGSHAHALVRVVLAGQQHDDPRGAELVANLGYRVAAHAGGRPRVLSGPSPVLRPRLHARNHLLSPASVEGAQSGSMRFTLPPSAASRGGSASKARTVRGAGAARRPIARGPCVRPPRRARVAPPRSPRRGADGHAADA